MPPLLTSHPAASPAASACEATDPKACPSSSAAAWSPQLLATVSHELRVPLNGVHGMATLLMGTSLTAEQRRYVATIQSSVEALIGLAGDVLDWASLETGKVTFESTSFLLRTLVDDAIDVCAEAAHRKNVEIVGLFDDALEERVIGDPFRVRQALLNLVSNAVKFTSEGLVVVRISATADSEGLPLVRFEVSDTGPGIAPAALDGLFHPYVSADRVLARKLGGTGLGLAICRDLASRMGGDTGVSSTVGVGSTFFFTASLPADAAPQRATLANAVSRPRVLVVAALEPLLERTLQSLRRCHTEVAGVATLSEANALFQGGGASGQPYDLVIVDQSSLSALNGSVRAVLPDIPLRVPLVRLCRTTEIEQLRGDSSDHGFNGRLMKPVRDEAVRALLEEFGPHAKSAPDSRTSATSHAQRPRVLIVDDDPASVTVAARFAERLGCKVDVATEGTRVLQMLQRERYAAVCLDINLPDVNGCEVARQWRGRESEGTRTPFIAMTAHSSPEDRDRFLTAGLDDHLAKPLRLDALRTALERWIPELQPARLQSQ